MRLLIITQKVDRKDPVLGFFHRWLELFAGEIEEVFVIAQFVGEYNLPQNVRVVSLGKENDYSKLRQVLRFWFLLARVFMKIDRVFVHMVPLWVILGSPFYTIFRKPIYLWYVHPRRNWLYRVSRIFVRKIFTPVRPTGFSDSKVVETGHGIDVERFKPNPNYRLPSTKYKLLAVGRISPVKRYLEMLKAVAILKNELGMDNILFEIIGGTVTPADRDYKRKLEDFIREHNLNSVAKFRGWVTPSNMPALYQSANLVLNFTPTGSFDKAMLEAMSVNVPVLVNNELFRGIIPNQFFIKDANAAKLIAAEIKEMLTDKKNTKLRGAIEKNHNLYTLIPRLAREMSS